MPGFAREETAYLTAAGDTDALMRMVLELSSEMWVLRDRLTLLEHTLTSHGTDLTPLDQPILDPALSETLAEQRRLLTQRLIAAAAGTSEQGGTSS